MGQALLAGALRAGFEPADVSVTTLDSHFREQIATNFGVNVVSDNAQAVTGASLVLVCVKPKDIPAVLAEIAPALAPNCVVVSVAVGITLAALAGYLPPEQPIIRAMPNTPASVGAGITAISPGPTVSPAQLALAQQVLGGSGAVVVVSEADQPAVGAISGSGPAYVAYFIEALIEAGVQQGLTRAVATQLAIETFKGTALMLAATGEHPSLARERVTSPGGTTAAALHALDTGAVRGTIAQAVAAAIARTNAIASPH
jgi:pyrroline-5-carboxylate reductase